MSDEPNKLAADLESKMRACKTEAGAATMTYEIGMLVCGILAALEAEREAWSDDCEAAPPACHVLAARFDIDAGEWVCAVVASPPSHPFTHWRMLDTAQQARER